MKKLFYTFSIMLLFTSWVTAQRTVTGTVMDDDGLALIGANVLIPNTTLGVITDIDGAFSIKVPDGTETLSVSYIGFDEKLVNIVGLSNIDVTLSSGKLLNEVVITGYGVQDKSAITGSVTSVGAAKIEALPIASIDQILQGQAPGLTVLSGSGQPGSNDVSVVLRGPSTIQGSNSPIYIMDGMQISASDFGAINSNDIESVTILKDASSTAIYGASGANGVILIKTKTGKDGKAQISYSGQVGFSNLARENFELMNSTEKLAFEEIARRGPGWDLSPNNPANAGASEEMLAANATELARLQGINTNWRDIVFRTGKVQQHNLSVLGGDDNTKFYVSGNYYGEEGVLNGSDFDRGTIRTNWEEQLNDKIKVGLSSSGGYSKSRFIQSENAVNLNNPSALAYLTNPYAEVYDEDGEFAFSSTGRNPVEEVFYNYDEENTIKGIAQLYTEIQPINHVKFTGRYGIDYTNSKFKDFVDPNSRLSTTVQGGSGSVRRAEDNTTWLTFSNVLGYDNIFAERHRFDVLVGQETRRRNLDNYGVTVYGIEGGLESTAGATAGSADNPDFIPNITGLVRKKVLNSYFTRANYTLDDKYNVTAGVRRDGSSVFGENNQYGTFWNVGASWIVSREDFLVNNDFLSYLKVGLSYGTNGNSEGILEREKATLYANGDYAGSAAFIPSSTNPGNPDLKWEVLKGYNAILEFGLFDDLLTGNLAWYRNDTEDLFISQDLPLSAGATSLTINAGSMRNQGYEVELNANVIKGDPYVSVGVQFAYNKNEIIDLGQVDEFEQGTSIIREGLPLGTHYVEEWGGVDPTTGNPLYVDENGNYTDDFGAVGPKAEFGSYFAPWSGGVNLSAGFKGFRLSALGAFVYGNTLFNNQTFFQENPNFAQFNLSRVMNDIWMEPGDVTDIQRIGTARQFSSKDLEDGSFFRLRNVSLSYDIPTDNKVLGSFTGINIFVQGRNLFTATKFSGFDPEDSNNIASYGFPASKTVTFGVNAKF